MACQYMPQHPTSIKPESHVSLDYYATEFLTSAAKLSQCPPDTGREVAFAGRSNAGKSSAINCLTGRTKLARTSKTPGRTQLLNFFSVGADARLVDLPGYGYAKVPEAVQRDWHLTMDYFRHRHALAGIVLVMDIRHPLKPFDEMMLEWAAKAGTTVHLLLTKADKLKRGPALATLTKVKKETAQSGATAQLFSATSKLGRDDLVRQLDELLTQTVGAP